MKRYLIFVPLFLLACSLWTPYAAMTEPQPPPPASPGPTAIPPATLTPTPLTLCRVTAAEALHLRSGPGTLYQVIEYLYPGDLLTIRKTSGAWLHVAAGDLTGWVHSEYCR